jgi:hypothetical protein
MYLTSNNICSIKNSYIIHIIDLLRFQLHPVSAMDSPLSIHHLLQNMAIVSPRGLLLAYLDQWLPDSVGEISPLSIHTVFSPHLTLIRRFLTHFQEIQRCLGIIIQV